MLPVLRRGWGRATDARDRPVDGEDDEQESESECCSEAEEKEKGNQRKDAFVDALLA